MNITAMQMLRSFTYTLEDRMIKEDISPFEVIRLISTEINYQLLSERDQIIEAWVDGNMLGRNGNIIEEYDTGIGYYKEMYNK